MKKSTISMYDYSGFADEVYKTMLVWIENNGISEKSLKELSSIIGVIATRYKRMTIK